MSSVAVLLTCLAVLAPWPGVANETVRYAAADIELAADNTDAIGLWSDGDTFWVADDGDNKLYAYRADTGERDADRDVALDPANGWPMGLWSHGDTLWVSDPSRDTLYGYRPPRRAGTRLSSLGLTGIDLPPFASGTRHYAVEVGHATTGTTVTAEAVAGAVPPGRADGADRPRPGRAGTAGRITPVTLLFRFRRFPERGPLATRGEMIGWQSTRN